MCGKLQFVSHSYEELLDNVSRWTGNRQPGVDDQEDGESTEATWHTNEQLQEAVAKVGNCHVLHAGETNRHLRQ